MHRVALLFGLLAMGGACRPAADEGDTLLFLGRSSAARVGHLSWAADAPRSRLIAFDGDLRVVKTISHPRLSSPVAVAPYPGSRLLVSERTGEGVVFDTAGNPVREWESPFPATLYASDGDHIYGSRSPFFVQFVAEDGSAPLLWVLDTLGIQRGGLGITHIPDVRYLAQLVNAGPVAAKDRVVYFAPLVRDEILRLDRAGGGSPVWRGSRGLIPEERDPRFATGKERRVEHALINIAMTLGPDGRLYVLGGQDSAATRLRLDVLDPETGEILESRILGTPSTAVAVNRRGRIRILDVAALLAQIPTKGRDLFAPAFALSDIEGRLVRLGDYRGKVTLVNFWASWCEPCRAEFPHMAELYRATSRKDFDIAAISDDVSYSQMRAFVKEFRPPFPILVGHGRMKAAYHFRGLPYSVLLDRQGRVIERIFGFGGEQEFAHLRAIISGEIDADSAAAR